MSKTASFWTDLFDGSDYYKGPPLTDALVAGAEQALGYALPEAYLPLRRVKNGGVPRRQCQPTSGTSWTDNLVRVTAIVGIRGRWGIAAAELAGGPLLLR
jgi:hypothetical protein